MKKFLIKGQEYYLDFIPNQDYYEIKAYNANKEQVGFITMRLNIQSYSRNLWLMKYLLMKVKGLRELDKNSLMH